MFDAFKSRATNDVNDLLQKKKKKINVTPILNNHINLFQPMDIIWWTRALSRMLEEDFMIGTQKIEQLNRGVRCMRFKMIFDRQTSTLSMQNG